MSQLTDTLTGLFASGTQITNATIAGLDNQLLLAISNIDKAGIAYAQTVADGDVNADQVGAALVQIAEQLSAVNPNLTDDQEQAFDGLFKTIVRGATDAQTVAGKDLFVFSLHYQLLHEKRAAAINAQLALIPAQP